MENIREHLYLAALLHDIGKFYQRADTGSVSTSKFLSAISKASESAFLPLHNGFYTHKHCLWTAQFIDDNNTVFKNLVGANLSDLANKNNLFHLAACHHLKKEQLSELGQIIKEADCLSSGMDREIEEAFKDDQNEKEWDAFKKKRMTSVLETIYAKPDHVKYHLPVSEISLSKDFFPKEEFENEPDYERLWRSFVNEFKLIQTNNFRAFSETFLNLLYKYTVCIPASTVNYPDVSLYDHAKTTAALAVCLFDYQSGKSACSPGNDQPFLLIGADFSGIQSYLYQIVSKYAGKNLKGRSFFLRILSDAVVRYLLRELNLFQANVIYNSGGTFYLIAPNTEFVKERLAEAIKTIEEQFFASFGTALFVAIDSIPISKDDLMHKDKDHNLGIIWDNLFIKRNKKKSCKFADLITTGYSKFFEPLLQGGEALRDRITGEEFLPDEKAISFEENFFIKQNTFNQIELGKRLRDTDLLIISEMPLIYWNDKYSINPADLGFHYYFVQKDDLSQSVDGITIIRFNNLNFNIPIGGNNNTYEFLYYGGNKYNGQTFEEMTDNPNFSRLGVLRMDVDNLGSIFQSGISFERATLSRYAALSRSFDYYFSGYLNTIWEETERSFIIYSGGDDLFIVGSWDTVIRLAKKINEDFHEFTCYNPNFSISGGVAIVSAKFPIMKGAEESAEEEKAAKNHTINGKSKNSISFLDFPLNWDTEFPVVESLKDEFVRLDKEENESKSLLTKIMAHAANAGIKAHKITHIKTYWMLTYDLSRMKDRTKINTSKVLINNCITEVCGNKPLLNGKAIETEYHALELWAFAARWAELELRKDKQ